MIKVLNRSEESWGSVAKLDDEQFEKLINTRKSKTWSVIKEALKRQKNLKTYKVTFKKTWESDTFELQAESDRDIGTVAHEYWKANKGNIGFKEKPYARGCGDYSGYDSIDYVKARNR